MYRYFYTFFNVLFVGLVLSVPIQAQVLEAYIVDVETQEPLMGASVYGNASCNAISDFQGLFSISNCSADSLVISYLGYETRVFTSPFDLKERIELTKSSSLLDQITVTGSRYRQSANRSIVGLDRVNSDRIQRENTPEIDDMLNNISGVQVVDGQANIRGGSGYSYGAGSRVMVILDGLPMLQGDAGLSNWRDLPTENIASIEVLKGASSIIYGSSALNGVINLETQDPGSVPTTEISAQYRAFDNPPVDSTKWWESPPKVYNASIVHRRKIGKLDLTGRLFYLKEESFIKHKVAESKRGGLKLRYRFQPNLIAGVNFNYNEYVGNNPFYWQDSGSGLMISDTTSFSRTDAQRYSIDPYLKYYDGSGGQHRLMNRFYSISNISPENRSNESQSYLSEYQYFKDFSRLGLKFTGGLLFSHLNSDSDLFSQSKFTQNNFASYAQIEKAVGSQLILLAGLRYENNNTNAPDSIATNATEPPTYFQVNPEFNEHSETVARLGFNYELNDYSQFRASWGQGYRYPAIAERYISANIGVNIVANPELKPETGWTSEIGYRQGLIMGKTKGFFDVSLFQMEYEDMMEFNLFLLTSPPIVGFQSRNIGNTRIRGIDVVVQSETEFSKQSSLSLNLGYNYIDPRFKDFTEEIRERSTSEENVLKYRQRHIGKAHAFWKFKNWGIGSTYRYLSKTEAVDLIFYQQFFILGVEAFDQEHNDNRHILDLILSYSWGDGWTVRFNAKNLTNEIYTLRPAQLEDIRSFSIQLGKKWSHKKN